MPLFGGTATTPPGAPSDSPSFLVDGGCKPHRLTSSIRVCRSTDRGRTDTDDRADRPLTATQVKVKLEPSTPKDRDP